MGTIEDQRLLTTGAVALALGCGVLPHHIDRLARREAIPYRRAGHIRLFLAADLPAIRRVCKERGYYRPAAEMPHS